MDQTYPLAYAVVTVHILPENSHAGTNAYHVRTATAHARIVTACTVALIACVHPFDPTETAYEKIAKPFLLFERVFALSDPHVLLKDLSSRSS